MLLVVSAPSGAGKTTLSRRFLASRPDARFSVSVTTRSPRGTERDGVDYHFVAPERFDALIEAGALAEWAEVHGNRYGTLRTTAEEALASGSIAVFDIDVQGGAQVKALWPSRTVAVFVLPPSIAELERRLRARSTESEDAILRRLAAARSEIRIGVIQSDYLIVNDDLDEAARQLGAIVDRERARLAGGRDAAAEAIAGPLSRDRFDVRAWTS